MLFHIKNVIIHKREKQRMISWLADSFKLEQIFLSVDRDPRSVASYIKKRFLDDGYGFVICDYNKFENPQGAFASTIDSLGEKMAQNFNKDLAVVVENRGVKMTSGGRYHQSNEGGSLHTDCPQWSKVPDYLALFCLNQSVIGGESKLISAIKIHEIIKQSDKKTGSNFLKTLESNFHFDKRGEYAFNESPTTFAPIFSNNRNQFSFRFLDSYVESGHKIVEKPLSLDQYKAIRFLKQLLKSEPLIFSYKLKKGQALFCNNKCVAHGRSSFEDTNDNKRKLMRYWIKNE